MDSRSRTRSITLGAERLTLSRSDWSIARRNQCNRIAIGGNNSYNFGGVFTFQLSKQVRYFGSIGGCEWLTKKLGFMVEHFLKISSMISRRQNFAMMFLDLFLSVLGFPKRWHMEISFSISPTSRELFNKLRTMAFEFSALSSLGTPAPEITSVSRHWYWSLLSIESLRVCNSFSRSFTRDSNPSILSSFTDINFEKQVTITLRTSFISLFILPFSMTCVIWAMSDIFSEEYK